MNDTKAASNRADSVRNRRTQQTAKRVTQSGSRTYKHNIATPITTRRGSVGQIPTRRPQTNVKRRYEIALNVPGAQVRMPALPVIEVGWRWVSGLAIVLCVWLLYTLWNGTSFIVREAEIIGNERTPAVEINRAIAMTGRSIVEAEPAAIQAALQAAFTEFSSIDVRIGFPAKVIVDVIERQPRIAWIQGDKTVWVDDQGIAFPSRGELGGLVQILATGSPLTAEPGQVEDIQASMIKGQAAPAAPFLPVEMVNALQLLAPFVPEDTTLIYDPEYGLGWNDTRGWQVYFGQQVGDMAVKLNIYQAIVENLTQKGISPAMISVEYPDAPFYRLEQ